MLLLLENSIFQGRPTWSSAMSRLRMVLGSFRIGKVQCHTDAVGVVIEYVKKNNGSGDKKFILFLFKRVSL